MTQVCVNNTGQKNFYDFSIFAARLRIVLDQKIIIGRFRNSQISKMLENGRGVEGLDEIGGAVSDRARSGF